MSSAPDTLERLFNPKSIAVVGATNDEAKVGFNMLHALRDFPGALYPVNPKASEIQGLKAYPNLKAVDRPVDLIALCIPARSCPDAVRDAVEIGVGAVLIAGGGFGEVDEEGKALQEEILAECRRFSIRLLGPNTAGFVNPAAGVTACFNPLAAGIGAGSIGVVSQSGAMNLVLSTMIQNGGMGVSIGVGTGNALDIGVPEMVRYLSRHEKTRCIAVYLEGVEDGRALYDAVHDASRIKPVVVFTVGKADIGEFAVSHTGKMIGSFALKKAALVQAGAVVVHSSEDLVDAASALSKARLKPKPSPGVGLLTGQAGPALVISDYLRTKSVSMPQLGDSIVERIAGLLPLRTYIKNPVDTARPLQSSFLEVLSLMAEDEQIDLLVAYAMHEPMCIEPVPLFRSVRRRTGKPLIFGTSGLAEDLAPTLRDLEAMSIPAFASPDRAAVAAWALVEDSRRAHRKERRAARHGAHTAFERFGGSPDEARAKALLNGMGIATPRLAVCETHADAIECFRRMKQPCVAKILSPAVAHKTEAGGVHPSLETAEQLVDALERIDAIELAGDKKYLIEEMAPAGLDIIIGAKNDAGFGPAVMVGLGGTAAEALGDRSIRMAPLDVRDALDMLAELRAARLFDGWRGSPAYDKSSVAEALVKIGDLMVQHPEIREMDLNPVRVYEKGIMALDALIVRDGQERGHDPAIL